MARSSSRLAKKKRLGIQVLNQFHKIYPHLRAFSLAALDAHRSDKTTAISVNPENLVISLR